jgi:predicted small metal-binding protein
MNIEQLTEEIKTMSVDELAELVDKLDEHARETTNKFNNWRANVINLIENIKIETKKRFNHQNT